MAEASEDRSEGDGDASSPDEKTDLLYHHEVGLKPFIFATFGRLSYWLRKTIRLLIPLSVLVFLTFVPLMPDMRMQHMLAIFAFVALMWGLESVPLPVTALSAPVLLVAYGIFGTGRTAVVEAFIPFADPVVYLMMGSLFMAEAFRKTGLDRRFLYFLASKSRGNMRTLLLAMMVSSGVLSMWVTNTAAAAMLIPLAVAVASRLKGPNAKRYGSILILGTGTAVTAGGMATIVGFSGNAIATSFLSERISWTFLDWMRVGVPMAVITVALTYLLLSRLIPRAEDVDLSWIDEEIREMGPLSSREKRLLVIFVSTVFLWILGGELATELGHTPEIASAAVVSLGSALFIFATRTVEWEDARTIPWEIFLIIGAGLALGRGLIFTGAATVIALGLGTFVSSTAPSFLGLLPLVLFSVLLAVILSSFLGSTAGAAIFIPIMVGMAGSLGIENVKLLVLPVALGVLTAYMTPTGSPPFILVYSSGFVSRREIFRIGSILTFPSLIVVAIGVYIFVTLGLV
jgi:sodium-dependent dicarboxylate transporter 2/3/5